MREKLIAVSDRLHFVYESADVNTQDAIGECLVDLQDAASEAGILLNDMEPDEFPHCK